MSEEQLILDLQSQNEDPILSKVVEPWAGLGPATFGLVTEEDFAECMNVSQLTVAKWRRDGAGPAYTRVGNRVFYQTKNIYVWLDHRTYLSGSHDPAYPG